MKFSRLAAAASVFSLLITTPDISLGRALYDMESSWRPAKVHAAHVALGAVHNVGKIGLSVTNQGNFGTGFIGAFVDPVLGVQAPSCEYPYPSQLQYLFSGAFWIGAISGRDTLVSVGADGWQQTREMWPDEEGSPNAQVIRRTIKNENDPDAISEQDIICKNECSALMEDVWMHVTPTNEGSRTIENIYRSRRRNTGMRYMSKIQKDGRYRCLSPFHDD